MGGIIAGVFTPTEASTIAVLYTFVLAVLIYREIAWRDLPGVVLEAVITTAIVLFLVAASQAMSWALAYGEVPQAISAGLLQLTANPIFILLLINLILLTAGTILDMTPAVLIFTPIFLPVVIELGVDPIHFGIILIMNLCIGLCTPPVGTVLAVGSSVSGVGLTRLARWLLPFYVALIGVLLLTTFIPEISLWLPKLFGF
jgi:tripartite ATP-independent transporter DctM subunit